MNQADLEAALKAAFSHCDYNFCPLSEEQKRIMLQVIEELIEQKALADNRSNNPLDELSSEQRQSFWQYIQVQEQQNLSWKAQLLNDWLQGRDSGAMQFIREVYGFEWLNRIKPGHIAKYAQEALKLKLGDRIEVSNGLWEWVQETGPCSREWFSCTVIAVDETNCTIRFSNGAEYQIQGAYNWNRYNWRWVE
jgi:hypothetical protein